MTRPRWSRRTEFGVLRTRPTRRGIRSAVAISIALVSGCAAVRPISLSSTATPHLVISVRRPERVTFLAVLACGASPAAQYPLISERDSVSWQIVLDDDAQRRKSDGKPTVRFTFGVIPSGFRQDIAPRSLASGSCYEAWAGDGSRLTSVGFRVTDNGRVEIVPARGREVVVSSVLP